MDTLMLTDLQKFIFMHYDGQYLVHYDGQYSVLVNIYAL